MDITLSAFSGAQCASVQEDTGYAHEDITKDLIKIIADRPEIGRMFEESIAAACKINPDRMTNPAQTLEDYFIYLDWCAKPMPWMMKPALRGATVFERIDQGLEYFYFILDQPLHELEGRGLFYNSLQYVEPVSSWMKRYACEWGRFLSSPDSWNENFLKMVVDEPRFNIDKGWYEDTSNWHSFNDFFSRKLASPDVRPVYDADDASAVVSPADSVPQGVWDIDDDSNIAAGGGVLIKSNPFFSVKQLVGRGSRYVDSFANGKMTHTFLNVDDYHRYHFPVSGTVKEVRMIPAQDAAGGITRWNSEAGKYSLDSETPGWQSIETRGCVIVETDDCGLVAVLPIGMSQVSSVNFTDNVRVGARVNKGEELGYFLFGGSDIAMIFQERAGFELACGRENVYAPENEKYAHICVGERYGKCHIS